MSHSPHWGVCFFGDGRSSVYFLTDETMVCIFNGNRRKQL